MTDFTLLVDLASERLGGAVLLANDEFFAPKENLLKPAKPIYVEGKYTEHGKWMDGWETRRRRTPGFDWCIVQLGLPGIVRGVVVDTSHFKGNYPEHCVLEACAVEGSHDAASLTAPEIVWSELLPQSQLKGDALNPFSISDPHRYTHLRLKIYPDGGVARLRVYGEVIPDWKQVLAGRQQINLAAVQNGARVVACSDKFFSAPQNLLLPGGGLNMGDGWETRRRRGPGFDWVVIRLGIPGMVQRVEVDTAFFRGNYPESFSLEVCEAADALESALAEFSWREILPRTLLNPDSRQVFEIPQPASATHVRFNILPDGGVSRLRIHGVPTREGKMAEGLRLLNALPDEQARAILLACCGSSAWVAHMLSRRPFVNAPQLLEIGARTWESVGPQGWREAFNHHPQIGESRAAVEISARSQRWSEQEQGGTQRASPQLLAELARVNASYRQRFGHTFIVCATGKTGEEMLAMLKQRLVNDPEAELRIAAEEQRSIMRLRLEKLLEL